MPDLDAIIKHHERRALLAYPELVKEFGEAIKDLPSEIPPSDLKRNAALSFLWPMIQKARLQVEGFDRDLTQADKNRIKNLEKKSDNLLSHPDVISTKEALEAGSTEVFYMHPHKHSIPQYASRILSGECEPLHEHVKRTWRSKMKFLHDAQMGGSFYFHGNDTEFKNIPPSKYSFLQRSFMCLSKHGHPLLFMDSIEGGHQQFNRLDQWRGWDEEQGKIFPNRVHHVYLALAANMYLAEQLEVGMIIPRDFELVELSKNMGLIEKPIFEKGFYWKVGLHSLEPNTGIYVHALYRGDKKNGNGAQLKHRVMFPFPLTHSAGILSRLEKLCDRIKTENRGRRKLKPKTNIKLDAAETIFFILDEYMWTPDYRREAGFTCMRAMYENLNKTLNRKLALPNYLIQ